MILVAHLHFLKYHTELLYFSFNIWIVSFAKWGVALAYCYYNLLEPNILVKYAILWFLLTKYQCYQLLQPIFIHCTHDDIWNTNVQYLYISQQNYNVKAIFQNRLWKLLNMYYWCISFFYDTSVHFCFVLVKSVKRPCSKLSKYNSFGLFLVNVISQVHR